MAFPKVSVSNREVILLNGFERRDSAEDPKSTQFPDIQTLQIRDESDLICSMRNDHDAVAFGYVAGRWVAAA